MSGLNRVGLKRSYLRTFTESEIDQIHNGALQTLAQIDAVVLDDEVADIIDLDVSPLRDPISEELTWPRAIHRITSRTSCWHRKGAS
jgi:hypothetical protein